jgi:hypothetical protein
VIVGQALGLRRPLRPPSTLPKLLDFDANRCSPRLRIIVRGFAVLPNTKFNPRLPRVAEKIFNLIRSNRRTNKRSQLQS